MKREKEGKRGVEEDQAAYGINKKKKEQSDFVGGRPEENIQYLDCPEL